MSARVRRLLRVALAFGVNGCGGDDATRDAVGPTDVASEADASEACPVAGTWQVAQVLCGADDISASWFGVIERTTIELTPADGGCRMRGTNRGASCEETDEATLTHVGGDTWTVVSTGISACAPDGCTFGGTDRPCTLGDRAGAFDVTLTLSGDALRYTSPQGICAAMGEESTTFVMSK